MAWWPFSKKKVKGAFPPEIEQIFDKTYRFLDDEAAQNNALPEELRRLMKNSSCDVVPGGSGDFGRTLTNPVPVNGPIGELIYLSRLETDYGIPITFHRLGSCNAVDIFEVMAIDGKYWDLLYVSLYYPRKSRVLPSGYRSTTDKTRRSLIRGTTQNLISFPKEVYRSVCECTERMIGIPIADSRLKQLDAVNLIRPDKQIKATIFVTEKLLRGQNNPIFECLAEAEKPIHRGHGGSVHGSNQMVQLFSEIFDLLKLHIIEAACEMDVKLQNDKIERGLTYVLLYMFTTLMFMTARRSDPSSLADFLTKHCLDRLSQGEVALFDEMLREYRDRYEQLKFIKFLSKEAENELSHAFTLSRLFTARPDAVFGTVLTTLFVEVLGPLREGVSAIQNEEG